METIAENLAGVTERIEAAARRAGRKPEEIRLVAVSKTVDAARIKEGIDAGIKILGENYVQEAKKKIELLGKGVAWHFIGHLQSNKAKAAVRLFDLVHAVDSLNLAKDLSRVALQEGRVLPVLLEVNIGGEATKFGAGEAGLLEIISQISILEGVLVQGLMAMPPFSAEAESSRPYFARLRRLAEEIARQKIPRVEMRELSMGMSGDFEVAIEEGATLVRVGTAIFGPRPAK